MALILNTLSLISIAAMMQDNVSVCGSKAPPSLIPDELNEGKIKPGSTGPAQTVPDLDIPSINKWLNEGGRESFLENRKHKAFMSPPHILVLQSKSKDQCTNYFAGLQKHEMLVSQLLVQLRPLRERDPCNECTLYDYTQSYTEPEIMVDKEKDFVSIKCTFRLKGNPLNQRTIKVAQYRNTISNDAPILFAEPDEEYAQLSACSSLLYFFITIQNELARHAQHDFPSINMKYLKLPPIEYDHVRFKTHDYTWTIVKLVLIGIVCLIILPLLAWLCVWRKCFALLRGGRSARTVIVTRDPPPTTSPPELAT